MQERCWTQRQIVTQQKIAPIRHVLRIVQIPHVVECVVGRCKKAIERESSENPLLLALPPNPCEYRTSARSSDPAPEQNRFSETSSELASHVVGLG